METRKEKMQFEYETPRVDDYVRWTTSTGMVHEGWVYFVVMNITIELGVKDKPEWEYTVKESTKRFITYSYVLKLKYWSELEYIKTRKVSK